MNTVTSKTVVETGYAVLSDQNKYLKNNIFTPEHMNVNTLIDGHVLNIINSFDGQLVGDCGAFGNPFIIGPTSDPYVHDIEIPDHIWNPYPSESFDIITLLSGNGPVNIGCKDCPDNSIYKHTGARHHKLIIEELP